MPFSLEGSNEQALQVDVRPSAVLELTWALCCLHKHGQLPEVAGLQAEAAALNDELAACWDDGLSCLPDASILAERAGALLMDEADTFLHALDRAAQVDGAGLELLSETLDVRDATLARLERLRRDPAQRRRYARLLGRVWELLRSSWEDTGRDVVRQACADWSHRLRQGAELRDLLSSKHVWQTFDLDSLLSKRRRVVLSPMYFAAMGGILIDMTGYVHIGGPLQPHEADRRRRQESDLIASRLKVLADGTRVALLRELAVSPASVTDLARRFNLAQPTVSNHVRLLRDAGLLESTKDGARVLYSAPRERLDRVLADTRHLLVEH